MDHKFMAKSAPMLKNPGRDNSIISITTYLIVIVYIVDQLSKKWATESIQTLGVIPVTSFLNLDLVWNRGLTVDLFGYDFSCVISYILIVLGLVFFFALSRWRLETTSSLAAAGIGFSMGGILGNLTDRLRLGASVSFLDFHMQTYHWLSFNLADAAIFIGVLLLMLEAIIVERAAG
jgi:signal peptidase II